MKRRSFLAGLIAAPAVAGLAPMAEASVLPGVAPGPGTPYVPRTATETQILAARLPKSARSGFTAEELQNVADAITREYLRRNSNRVGYANYEFIG